MIPYKTKRTNNKKKTLMQKKEKENVLFMYLFIYLELVFLSLFIWGVSFLVSGSSQEAS